VLDKIKLNKFLILALLAAFLLAVGIRAGILFNTRGLAPQHGTMTFLGEAARNLVEGRGYVVDEEYAGTIVNLIDKEHRLIDIQDVPPPQDEQFTAYYGNPPGTSALLASTYWIFGEYRYIYLRIIQAIIDSFGCLLMFLIGRELFNRRIGLISAFLYAICLPIAYLSTWALHDALMPFITLVSLYFFIKAVRRRAMKFYLLSALFTGIGCYFQPTILLLPFIFGLALLIFNLRKTHLREHITNTVKVTIIMVTVVVLVISPWIARNYYVTGAVMGMRPGLWQGIWEGFGEFQNPVGAVLDDAATYKQIKEEVGYDIKYGTPEYDAVLRGKVLNTIKEYPGWWLSILARRVPRSIVYFSELGVNYYPRDERGNLLWNEYLRQNPAPGEYMAALKSGTLWEFVKSHPYSTFYKGLVVLFAIVPVLLSIAAIWLMRRNWRPLILVAAAPVCFSMIGIFIFVASYKSMIPGSLGYIIFSAITLGYIYSRIKGTRDETVELATPPN
jgi:4-amino-4-deoxy-L-arabinose transferase-like glycosyltransferase